jgi:PAS domain S-box-containing protein
MKDQSKNKKQLLSELADARKRIAELEESKSGHKQAEEKLRDSEANYRAIFDTANDAIFVHDIETGDILDVNRKMLETYGYTLEEALQLNVEALSSAEPPFTQENANRLIEKAVNGKPQLFEWMAKDKGGRLFWVEVSLRLAVIGGRERLLATVRDINERKQAEQTIKQSEKRYRELYESSRDGYSMVTMEGKILESNSVCREMLGYTDAELRTKTYEDITPEKWHALEAGIVENQVMTRGYSDVYVKELRRKDGTIFPIEMRAYLIQDDDGEPVGMWGFVRDITERRQAEQKIRQSEKRYRELYEGSRDGFGMVNMDGEIIESNSVFKEMLGYTEEELREKTYEEITPKKWHSMEAEIIENQVMKRGYSEVFAKEYRRKDGTIFPIEIRVYLIEDEDGESTGMWAFVRDITERKQAEQALREAAERGKG